MVLPWWSWNEERFVNLRWVCLHRRCALLDAPRQCHYRMKLGDQESWHSISQICRNRVSNSIAITLFFHLSNGEVANFIFLLFQITAVIDFLNYLRYIERGLVKSSGIHLLLITWKSCLNIRLFSFYRIRLFFFLISKFSAKLFLKILGKTIKFSKVNFYWYVFINVNISNHPLFMFAIYFRENWKITEIYKHHK